MTRVLTAMLATLLLGASAHADADDGTARTLRCQGDACSPSVAWLVRETAGDVLGCTAFVVTPDVVATARHCVATSRSDGSRDAGSRFELVFAAGAGFAIERRDAHVLRLAPDDELSFQSASDWALLALDEPTTRPAIATDSSGMGQGTEVVVRSVVTVDAREAMLVASRCTVAQNSLFAPHMDGADAPVQVLAGCELERGSSGAPVIDVEGRARALVHGSDRRDWPWREPLRFPIELAGAEQTRPSAIAYATSFVCVDFAGDGTLPPSCDAAAWRERTRHPGVAASRHAAEVLATLERRAEAAAREAERVASMRDPREGWRVSVVRDGVAIDVVVAARCLADSRGERPRGARVAVVVDAHGTPTVRSDDRPQADVPVCTTAARR